MFGFAGLHAACQNSTGAHPDQPSSTAAAEGVVQRVVTFADGTPVDDDMTVLLVRRLPAATTALSATTDADVRYTRLADEAPDPADATYPVLEG